MLAALVLLTGCDLRQVNAMKAFVLLVIGLQSLLIFGETNEVNWAASIALALGSAVGAFSRETNYSRVGKGLGIALARTRGGSGYLAPDSGR